MLGPETVIVILAAGESLRMGRTKQLLKWRDSTLIESAITSAINSNADRVSVILGANRDTIIPKIYEYPIELAHNEEWKDGLLTSIQTGINLYKDSKSILFMLADQPAVSTAYLNQLIEFSQSGNQSIAATKYNETFGVPVVFKHVHFNDILNLNKESGGAQAYIQRNREITSSLEPTFELYDIDTENDYKKYFSKFGQS